MISTLACPLKYTCSSNLEHYFSRFFSWASFTLVSSKRATIQILLNWKLDPSVSNSTSLHLLKWQATKQGKYVQNRHCTQNWHYISLLRICCESLNVGFQHIVCFVFLGRWFQVHTNHASNKNSKPRTMHVVVPAWYNFHEGIRSIWAESVYSDLYGTEESWRAAMTHTITYIPMCSYSWESGLEQTFMVHSDHRTWRHNLCWEYPSFISLNFFQIKFSALISPSLTKVLALTNPVWEWLLLHLIVLSSAAGHDSNKPKPFNENHNVTLGIIWGKATIIPEISETRLEWYRFFQLTRFCNTVTFNHTTNQHKPYTKWMKWPNSHEKNIVSFIINSGLRKS